MADGPPLQFMTLSGHSTPSMWRFQWLESRFQAACQSYKSGIRFPNRPVTLIVLTDGFLGLSKIRPRSLGR